MVIQLVKNERSLLELVGPHVDRDRRERIPKWLQEGARRGIGGIQKRLDPRREKVPLDQVSYYMIIGSRKELPAASSALFVGQRGRKVR